VLVEDPGHRRISECGCPCPICCYLVRAPHLKTRKLTRKDKRKAEELKRDRLVSLVGERGLAPDDAVIDAILADEDRSRLAALSAYGRELLRRCHGRSAGPPVLALWRQVAWSRQGARDKSFDLDAQTILDAEEELAAVLAESA
jgi:hypothetical protein